MTEAANPLLRLRNVFSPALLDQLITSGSNAALVVVAGKAMSEYDFGVFAIILTAYYLGNGSIRALYGEPLLVGWSQATQTERPELRPLEQRVAHISLLALVSIPVMVVVCFVNGNVGAGLLLALPGLYLQTIVRWTLYARDEYGRAVTMNVAWAAIMLGVPLFLLAISVDLVAWQFAAIWGLSGLAIAIWGLMGRIHPNAVWSLSQRKLAASWAAGRSYWFLYLLTSGTTQLCVLAVATWVGAVEVGAIRGAMLFFSPVGTLFGGLSVRSIQILARSTWTRNSLRRTLPKIMAPPVLLVVVWAAVVALVLRIDSGLLGDTTDAAVRLLPLAFLMQLGQGALLGPTWVLKGNGQLDRLNSLRAVSAVCAVIGTILGVVTSEPWIVMAGIAVGFWVAAVWAPRVALDSVPASAVAQDAIEQPQ